MKQVQELRPKVVHLVVRLLKPFIEEGIVAQSEANFISSNLNSIIKYGQAKPAITPKLLCQQDVADLLGLSLSNFKKLEHENTFPFKRRMVGGSVRFCNLDVYAYITAQGDTMESEQDE